MKRCLKCQTPFDEVAWSCPACGFEPAVKNGFPAFAPELSQDDGFKDAFFNELVKLESNNFWFRARNRIINWALRQYFPDCTNFLEIGCGTGFVLSGVAAGRAPARIHGSEISSAGLAYAAQRVPGGQFFQMDARQIPFSNEFDVIGAFDVIEHIQDDALVLQQMFAAIRPGGGLLLTVPQHQFLWSQTDVHACHVRRYEAADLTSKVRAAGFTIERTSSFVSLLLPLMMLSRWRDRKANPDYDPLAELRIGALANTLLGAAMAMERMLIQIGLNFPFGGSRLLIARKSA